MFKKEILPLAIFVLLVLWVTGSWGVSLLDDEGPNTASSSAPFTSTSTNTPTQTPTSTSTNTPTPTSTPSPTVTPTPSPTNTPTAIPIFLPQATATPEYAWQGRIVEIAQTGAGTIGVRAAGFKDHPVVLRSGGWESQPQLTGTKVELGDYSTEFGGLGPGDYTVVLVDLAELEITLEPGQFILVEFRYDPVTPP